ncbi:GNAT family N-acetyltransferase, partial [Xanthobacter autotrophicus]|uniref:GNAT family N-acetyltransferase n=1 Tax=Xanthobacter autotrophicus TaxID=280 RepID=UPI0024A654C2
DEVELARLIVDPTRRREGIGRRLVEVLLALAREHGRSDCFLRVVPDNTAARALYRSTGFVEVDEASMLEWNQGQPTTYTWMQHTDF